MVKLGFSKEEIMSNLQRELEVIRKSTDTWVEAIVDYCQKYDLEESDVIPYISPVILGRIKDEASTLNLIKKNKEEVSLPF